MTAGRRQDARSAREKAEVDAPDGIIRVGVEQTDRLPCPEDEPATDDRHGQRRRRQQGQDVVGAVAGRPVTVPVETVLAGQQPIERGHQVVVRARADLDDDQPGRRVRDEDR